MKYTKIRFLICIIYIVINPNGCYAQKKDSTLKAVSNAESNTSKDILRTANNLKSGNSLDVLTNFFQLGVNDITSNNHSFSFKSTLFALKVKADSSLLIDTNYINQKFSRNFQFNFALKLDSNYHFNGFNGGFTWSIVNKRDASVTQFINDYSQQFYTTLDGNLEIFEISLFDTLKCARKDTENCKVDISKYNIVRRIKTTDSAGNINSIFIVISKENVDLYNKTKAAVKKMQSDNLFSLSQLPKEFQVFASKNLETLFRKQDSVFKSNLATIAKQPLVTLSVNGNFDKLNSKLDGGDAELVWLKSFTSKAYKTGSGSNFESDFRITGNTKDTTINNSTISRGVVDAKWGINVMAIHNNKSIFEFKPNLELKNIFNGSIKNEKTYNFYANADLRIRITDNLWVPFTIKYDTKKRNFLGFLNVSINMNAFKS